MFYIHPLLLKIVVRDVMGNGIGMDFFERHHIVHCLSLFNEQSL